MTLTEELTTDEQRRVLSLAREVVAAHDPRATDPIEFLGARFDAGLAWVWFPQGNGGLGLRQELQSVVEREFRKSDAPNESDRNVIGYGMAAPTILTHGTPEQHRRFLRPLFTCEEIWCQLFSEPGSGSDVAGLATRAVLDGDEWVVNGQKVWTTMAHTARWGLLLARTDPDVPKHRGMTYFIVDMHAPGVEVRPLRQMTGDAEFNEVFFTDVRVPDNLRLDAVGAGWRVATTTLMNERVAIGGGVPSRASGPIHEAEVVYRATPRSAVERDRFMGVWVAAEVQRLTNMRARELRRAGTPGPEGSVAKLAGAELNKHVYELCVDLMGMQGTLYSSNYTMRRPDRAGFDGTEDVRHSFLRARANSIEGGTSEIMRNILGERVLGLAGEPRMDKDLPWAQVPRS